MVLCDENKISEGLVICGNWRSSGHIFSVSVLMIGLPYLLLPRALWVTARPPSFRCGLFRDAVRPAVINLQGWDRGVKTLPKPKRRPEPPPGTGKEADEKQRKFSKRSSTNFDTLGSWNHRVELQVNLEQSIKAGTLIPEVRLDKVGVATLLGRRKENEDRYYYGRLREDILMFAIFDGHGGAEAAEFAQEYFPKQITQLLEKEENHDLPSILRTAFFEVNNDFCRYVTLGNDAGLNSGTTATVCLLRHGNHLVVASVGDSKALLCRDQKVVRLTMDHKPTDPQEKARIKKAGGRIIEATIGRPRVNGKLDMTRSIGDVELKAAGVTAEPDVRSILVKHGKDAFLCLISDGISYVVSDQEVVDFVSACTTTSEAALAVADQALHFGSEDNATALIVPFGAWGKYAATAQTVQFSFGRNKLGSRYQ